MPLVLLATTPSSTRPHVTIRPASVADSAAIARVCLLTAYQGRSSQTLVRHPELPSQVRVLPYLHLPSGFVYVLVETPEQSKSELETEPQQGKDPIIPGVGEKHESRNVVGYVVGTGQTAQFEREIDTTWWPALKLMYPKDLIGTPLDRYFINLIHKVPPKISTGPAHIHVNVIDKYKGRGWDRLLVNIALRHLRLKERNNRSLRHCG